MSNSKNSILAVVCLAVIAITVGVITQQYGTKNKPLPIFEKLVILPKSKTITYGDFTDHNGNHFGQDQFKGYWNILFFGFTSCPDVCPNTMHTLKDIKKSLKAIGKWGNYRVIMVSVDPERDTIERLKGYIPYFDEEFIGLKTELSATTDFAKQLGILFIKNKAENGFYDVDHGTSLILINPNGDQAGVITAPLNATQISNDLGLLAQYFNDDHAITPTNHTAQSKLEESETEHSSHLPEHLNTSDNESFKTIDGLIISDAWIRPGPPNAPSMAAYLKLTNTSASDISIVDVESSNFSMAMIHDTIIEDDIAKMQHKSELIIPAGQTVTLSPLSTHLMLMRPIKQLKVDDKTDLTIISKSGAQLTHELSVQQEP